jgi:acyl-CoA thioesterase I
MRLDEKVKSAFRYLPQKCSTKRLQENSSRQGAKAQREECFPNSPNLARFASLREISWIQNFKYVWLVFNRSFGAKKSRYLTFNVLIPGPKLTNIDAFLTLVVRRRAAERTPVGFARWRALWFCLIAAWLSACGAERYDHVRNLRSAGESIICFGDSLTEGVGAGSVEDYPAALSGLMGVPAVNAGRRGDTTAQALARLPEAVLRHNPRLVIVLLGGNDFLRQVPRAETRANLEEIVRRIQDEGAMVAIAGMRLGLFTDEFSAIYEETAKKLGALYIPQVMRGILNDSSLRSDPIHPNGAGYRLVAERVAGKIGPLLREADRLRGGAGAG